MREFVSGGEVIARAAIDAGCDFFAGYPITPSSGILTPPPYERLLGDLTGAYSRRINIQHRLVYQVLKDRKMVKVIRMRTHYE